MFLDKFIKHLILFHEDKVVYAYFPSLVICFLLPNQHEAGLSGERKGPKSQRNGDDWRGVISGQSSAFVDPLFS